MSISGKSKKKGTIHVPHRQTCMMAKVAVKVEHPSPFM